MEMRPFTEQGDPTLLDVAGAMEALPALPLDSAAHGEKPSAGSVEKVLKEG